MSAIQTNAVPSVAIFGPQSKTPSDKYLVDLSSYIRSKEVFVPLVESLKGLPQSWASFQVFDKGFAALEDGPRYMEMMSKWISGEGKMGWANETPSGMLVLPMLTIIHITQYFQMLDHRRLKHSEAMRNFRQGGGILGYCGGMLSAISVACASSEEEIVSIACKAIRVAIGIGAAADLMDDNPAKGSSIMVVRLKYDGQCNDIVKAFPGTCVSAITDSKTVSIAGKASTLLDVEKYCLNLKLTVQRIPLRGKVHNPENRQLAADFSRFLDSDEALRIPDASALLVPFRSNITTEVMTSGSLSLEIATTIMVEKCNWYQVLLEVADDLRKTGRPEHSLSCFGIGDCVSLEPFRKSGLKVTKLDIFTLLPLVEEPRFSDDAIAVVGLAGRFPGANTVEELWDVISSGKSMAQECPKNRVDFANCHRVQTDPRWASKQKFYGNFMSDHDKFDHAFFKISSKEAMYMDPQQCLLLETAYQAMESSGYSATAENRNAGHRVGVFVGASFEDHLEHASATASNSFMATGSIRAFLSGKISHHFGWTGPSEVIDTACSSSLVAISRGCKAVQRGECDTALVGGVNFLSTPTHFLELGRASFLSPTGQCKPFDISADGYCRSEGVGLIVLKTLKDATANGDLVFGVIPGVATNQGSDTKSITVPHAPSQLSLYKSIMEQGGIDPCLVTYLEAHGTGTQVGDPIEIEGIRKGFASPDRELQINVGSIKANIGHTECAAGVAGVIKGLLMINKGMIPPMANFKTLNPKIPALQRDKITIPTVQQPWKAPFKAMVVNSYGAAGSNAAVLLCQPPQHGETKPVEVAPSFPIVLTAATRTSLQTYADVLKKYLLSPAGSKLTIGDVGLTLAKSRKFHKFAWTTTVEDIPALCKSLEDVSSAIELPETPKKVVLAFSGQTKQNVGLNKQFYDSCPLLQKYIEICNHHLLNTGSASIFPAVFQQEPISSIVTLQCAMFAVQYSCAKAWIDCGLKVDAVVGHSFGELTAMAVCGILSLESTIDIIRERARLIESRWGPDNGSMLVIHASVATVQDVISSMPAGSEKVEIACYNSKTSQVIVGTTSSLAEVEDVLNSTPKFGSFKVSAPNTSHGFHSYLTDGILADLDIEAKKHTFSVPSLGLESCTADRIATPSFERISQHMREPVFFQQAVSRLEQRLGSCIWLEAGVDSPVIPMVQRAVDAPQNHVFLPIKLASGPIPMTTISDVTTKLWRQGLPVSFFNFEIPGFHRVWLPPYSFERTTSWLPYLDPVLEALNLQGRQLSGPQVQQQMAVTLPGLVNVLSNNGRTKQFSIGTQTSRFKSIVSGHSVIGNPLCPAAMYLETAVIGVQLSIGTLAEYGYVFWDFRIDAPLGIDSRRSVTLELEGSSARDDWSFALKSMLQGSVKQTVHAQARFKFFTKLSGREASQFQYHQRFVQTRLCAIANNSDAEKLSMSRAYKLFSKVVNYSSVLMGIKIITMAGSEAVADIELPAAFGIEESCAIGVCDTVALDNFVQVVGLLINSSALCEDGDAFLATGADSTFVAPACDLIKARNFKVYASFVAENKLKAHGDIFVMTPDGALVSYIIGMHFSKIPLQVLRKILEPANEKNASYATTAAPVTSSPISLPVPSRVPLTATAISSALAKPVLKSSAPPSFELIEKIKTLVAEFAGMTADQLSMDAEIGDFGIDSLAAIELVEELENQFQIVIESSEITSTSIVALLKLMPDAAQVETLSSSSPLSSVPNIMTPPTPAAIPLSNSSGSRSYLNQLIEEYTAIDANLIDKSASLEALGIDSLSLIELKSAMLKYNESQLDFPPPKLMASDSPNSNNLSDSYQSSSAAFSSSSSVSGGNGSAEQVLQLIAEYAAIDIAAIEESASLEVLGVDSLSLIELKSALQDAYDMDEIDLEISTTVGSLLSLVGMKSQVGPCVPISTATLASEPAIVSTSIPIIDGSSGVQQDPLDVLQDINNSLSKTTDLNGSAYQANVVSKQNELVNAYILEAFQDLGCSMAALRHGEAVQDIRHAPKHSHRVARLWELLSQCQIVEKRGFQWVRSTGPLPSQSSAILLDQILREIPDYAVDCKLMAITGSNLAKCLSGDADATQMLFGNAANREVLGGFYKHSPLFKPTTDLLLKLAEEVIPSGTEAPFRILEIGGGTGSTSSLLAALLQSRNCTVEYTFTDISSTLVAAGKKKFAEYSWMSFRTLDLDKAVPADMRNKYDMVFGTNVVHATSNIAKNCTKLKDLLTAQGFMILLELTRNQNWFDLVFGLLSGWWGATDGRSHPLQTPEAWSTYFRTAGFPSFGASAGTAIEPAPQHLLIGSTRQPAKIVQANRYSPSKRYTIETISYKVVGDLRIEADIYYPAQKPSTPMPIALMIHGGGYMTLSKRAIRPFQTQHLLNNGLLPISIDYRLCPEISITDGPLTDIRDALIWCRETLPQLAKARGFSINATKLVIVGWSTGGHLAMMSASISQLSGLQPPNAILSFYAPTNFESEYFTSRQGEEFPERSMSHANIRAALSPEVISHYDGLKVTASEQNLGFLQPGDARSEMVLGLFKDGDGLSLLLNGFSTDPESKTPVIKEQIQSISPLAQVKKGMYTTPTFIIHGDRDEVVPHTMGVEMVEALKASRVDAGCIVVPRARHIFDLKLKMGDVRWDKYIGPGYEFLFKYL